MRVNQNVQPIILCVKFKLMATILLAWELGGNAGHVRPLSAIAVELQKRGHKVLIAVKDLAIGEKYLSPLGLDIVQAPVWNERIKPKTPPAINYAELLMRVGYLDVDQVTGQIRSWINLLKIVKPDLILGDHSPSVLLAARILQIQAGPIGSGFNSPPVLSTMPSIQPQNRFPKERFISSERIVLNIINEALNRCGGKPLTKLSEIFDTSCQYIRTYPECDHYGFRKDVRYWGIVQSLKNGLEPLWPKLNGPKVYVYMKSNVRPFLPLLESLKHLGWPSLIVSRNISNKDIESLKAQNLAFSTELLNLESVAHHASVVVTNCNHGTVVELLQRGCKQLVIPLQVEQAMLAHRLSSQGLLIASRQDITDYHTVIKKVNSDPILEAKVKMFKQQHEKTEPNKQLTALVNDIESKLR